MPLKDVKTLKRDKNNLLLKYLFLVLLLGYHIRREKIPWSFCREKKKKNNKEENQEKRRKKMSKKGKKSDYGSLRRSKNRVAWQNWEEEKKNERKRRVAGQWIEGQPSIMQDHPNPTNPTWAQPILGCYGRLLGSTHYFCKVMSGCAGLVELDKVIGISLYLYI